MKSLYFWLGAEARAVPPATLNSFYENMVGILRKRTPQPMYKTHGTVY